LTQNLLVAINHYGLTVVVLNVLLNQIGLPLPAIPTLIIAGAIAANGQLSIAALFSASVAACLAADCAWYGVGQRFGIRVLKTLCRISLEPDSCVSQTQTRFERWGVNSLVIAKFVPGLSIIAPPLAGAMRLGWLRFIFLSTLAAALWVGTWLLGGMLLSAQIQRAWVHLEHIGNLALLAALLLLCAYIGFKWWERRRFYSMLRMARISVAELHELMRIGAQPLIVDVRSDTARALEPQWIPGAVHMALSDAQTRLKDLPRDRDIILYCTCPSEASAARVAKTLMNHGFLRVRPLLGGLDAWRAAGYVVAGPATPPAR
jgi:membrane protein DedA with SNARE-associated domain/rhodanese-related sulfurtransferase